MVDSTPSDSTPSDSTLSQDSFASKVASLLGGQDQAVVPAASLTDFGWDTLCFERGDTLLLRFSGQGGEQTLSLPYEKFYVDEGHVAGSLEDQCLAPGDRILVRNKYPGYEGPVEFQKADTQGG